MYIQTFNWGKFHRTPIIGILRKVDSIALPYILKSFYEVGLSTIEITFNSEDAISQVRYILENFGDNLNVGMGTVRNFEELELSLNAGAKFIVTPNTNEDVIKLCSDLQVPIFAGALTPTEIFRAYTLGASMVKIFPASTMSPDFFVSLKGPLDNIPLIATGGIDIKNMSNYLNAGVAGLGIGSALFNKELIARKEWQQLENHMLDYVSVLRSWNNIP